MNLEIKYCPSTLQPGFNTYSPIAQKDLFGSRSKKVPHTLAFGPPGKNPDLTREYNEKRKSISISGVQEKYSLQLNKNELKLTGKKGTHILKPVPTERLERVEDMPANEHLSMQIARQTTGIKTAACGMIFFDDGSPAYITRRFDYKPDGTKYQLEDFATLLGKSPQREGDDFKYNASYFDIATMIRQYVPAQRVVLLQFFEIVVFNYLIANGDAHLKNFALIESGQGDYILAPAYDLMCTRLHIEDSDLGLQEGLYDGDLDEATYSSYGIYTGASFLAFANKLEIATDLAEKAISNLFSQREKMTELTNRSFLSPEGKLKYLEILDNRFKRLSIGRLS